MVNVTLVKVPFSVEVLANSLLRNLCLEQLSIKHSSAVFDDLVLGRNLGYFERILFPDRSKVFSSVAPVSKIVGGKSVGKNHRSVTYYY